MSRSLVSLSLIVATGLLVALAGSSATPPVAEAARAASADVQHTITVRHADGREDTILVIGWNHEVVSPRDAASGLPTGKRQHKPFVVTKPIDKSTPLLLEALTSGETFDAVTLVTAHRSQGRMVPFLMIKLERCFISSHAMHADGDGAGAAEPVEREHVSFTYQKITWSFHETGGEQEDTWPGDA